MAVLFTQVSSAVPKRGKRSARLRLPQQQLDQACHSDGLLVYLGHSSLPYLVQRRAEGSLQNQTPESRASSSHGPFNLMWVSLCMCTCLCVGMGKGSFMRGCAYMPCVIVHMWVSVCACVPMCTWSRACAWVCVFMYASVQMHVCMHVSVCVYVCMCGHTCLCASRKRTWGLTLAKQALYHRAISFSASSDLVVCSFLLFLLRQGLVMSPRLVLYLLCLSSRPLTCHLPVSAS